MNVNRRSYYKWCNNGKAFINNYDYNIAKIISEEHKNLKGIYGTLRLKHHIKNKYGLVFNHKLIRRYKQALNLNVVVRKRKAPAAHYGQERIVNNKVDYLIDEDFSAEKFGEKHSTDVTYLECADGTLYLSAIKDMYNGEIVSFETSNRNDAELIINSYKSSNATEETIVNSDQGTVYHSYLYVKLAEKLGFTRSMSRKGRCWENSPIENWFSQLKEEWIRPLGKVTRKEMSVEVKKYVQWYNTERIQKNLGYLSPLQYRLNTK